ncbi:MAG: hypothetical protein AAGE43_17085 [Pseudomonadota bacterium]
MLKQIQAATGLIFGLFLVFHLLNTWLAAFGPGVYDGVQGAFRIVYQAKVVEALILAALAVHLIVGVLRISLEPRRTLTPRARWHRYAGFFLLAFIGGHILAVRGSSWFYNVYPGFEGLAFSIAAVPGYFYPYYFLLAVAGLYHGLNGASLALGRLAPAGASPSVLSTVALKRTTVAGAFLTLAALGGLGGWYYDVGNVAESDFAELATGIAEEVLGVRLAP